MPLAEALAALKPLLEDPAVLKIGQNVKYDWSRSFARHGIEVAPIDDTMLISFALDAALHGHGMDELWPRRYLGHVPIAVKTLAGTGKAARAPSTRCRSTRPTGYAAEDADVTWRLLAPR